MTSDNTLFSIADTLNMQLHPVGEGYRGIQTVSAQVGPWKLELDVTAKADVLEKDRAAFFAHLQEDLWAYIISRKDGDVVHLILFSGAQAKIDKGLLVTPFQKGDLKVTIKRLIDAGGIPYSHNNGAWKIDPSVANL